MDTVLDKGMHIIHLNVNSLLGKLDQIREMFHDGKVDILTFSETKLDDSVTDVQIEIENYSVIRNDRNRHGGGVCMYVNSRLSYITRPELTHEAIETVWIEIIGKQTKPVLVCTIYRPPGQNDFYDILEGCMSKVDGGETVLIGDWNTDMLSKEAPVFKSFSRFCDLHSLHQLIMQPTRICDSTQTVIDLILTTDKDKILKSGVFICGLSDHYMVFCSRKKQQPYSGHHKTVQSRVLKNYNSEDFNHRLESLDWSRELNCTEVDKAWHGFKAKFISILNTVAPLKTTRVKSRSEPWMNSDILTAMIARDKKCSEYHKCNSKLKKRFGHDLRIHTVNLKKQRNNLKNKVTAMVREAQRSYIEDKVEENTNKPRELWKLLHNQLGCGKKLKTRFTNININSDNTIIRDKKDVATCLNIFFTTIATSLVDKLPLHSGLFDEKHILKFYQNLGVRKDDFKLATVSTDEVFKRLSALQPHKATGLDKIPSKFLKDSAASIAPIITHIVNLSIKQGRVPQDFKIAKVTPLYKKGSKLDPGNYRPISILSSISKVMEKIVYEQVEKYLAEKKTNFQIPIRLQALTLH